MFLDAGKCNMTTVCVHGIHLFTVHGVYLHVEHHPSIYIPSDSQNLISNGNWLFNQWCGPPDVLCIIDLISTFVLTIFNQGIRHCWILSSSSALDLNALPSKLFPWFASYLWPWYRCSLLPCYLNISVTSFSNASCLHHEHLIKALVF